MVDLPPDDLYIFIVDTEQYAGNFEREMCAYMTGQIGQCEKGQEEQEIFEKETGKDNDFFGFIIALPDEDGCFRPCSIWSTPGWFNNGLGVEFKEDNPAEEEKAIINYEENIKKYKMSNSKFQKYPAYLSVAIFMERMPTSEEITILTERAKKYPANKQKMSWETGDEERIKITGFRIIKRETKEKIVMEIKA